MELDLNFSDAIHEIHVFPSSVQENAGLTMHAQYEQNGAVQYPGSCIKIWSSMFSQPLVILKHLKVAVRIYSVLLSYLAPEQSSD